MAKPVVSKLHAETPRVLSVPALRQSFEREAVEIVASTPEAFGDYLTSEMVKWGRLVKSSGLKLE